MIISKDEEANNVRIWKCKDDPQTDEEVQTIGEAVGSCNLVSLIMISGYQIFISDKEVDWLFNTSNKHSIGFSVINHQSYGDQLWISFTDEDQVNDDLHFLIAMLERKIVKSFKKKKLAIGYRVLICHLRLAWLHKFHPEALEEFLKLSIKLSEDLNQETFDVEALNELYERYALKKSDKAKEALQAMN